MKLSCDTLRYGMGLNPWPGVFDWYSNPTYRLLDFLLGYIGFLLFNNYSGKLKVSKLEITLFQWGILLFYFVACRIFDKLWVPAVFLILVVLLVYAFTLSGGIFNIFFGNKLIVHLGNISFELFIIHQVIIKIMYAKLERWFGTNHMAVFVGLFVISLFFAELLSWNPIKKFMTRTVWGKN